MSALDNSRMHRLVIAWLVVLGACTQTVADEAILACTPLCQCVNPLPAGRHSCNATCIPAFERAPGTAACVQCLVDHTDRCTTLFTDCNSECSTAVPLTSYLTATSSPSDTDR